MRVALVVGQTLRWSASQAVRRRLTLARIASPSAVSAEADPAAVSSAGALDQPCRLEPRDVTRHARRGHALALRQLGGRDPGVLLDLDQERDLPACDAERLGLAPELPREPEQHRSEPVGKRAWRSARKGVL